MAAGVSRRGAKPAKVAAVLREAVGARVQPRLQGVEGLGVLMGEGFRQGAARSLDAWNVAIAEPFERARAAFG